MKNPILILTGLFVLTASYAQDYIPVLGDSNVWYIFFRGEGYYTHIIKTVGDTIIGDKEYIIADGTGYFFYEDTIEKSVYIRDPSSEKEILIYDFSLQKGDTIMLQRLDRLPMDYCECIVDSVSAFQLIGMESRAIYLSGEPKNWGKVEHAVWVEGVGSLGNLIGTAFEPDIDNLGELACYYKNGELLYQSSLSKELGKCNFNKPGGIKSEHLPVIEIYPNPFNDQIIMDGLPNWDLLIEIYDIHGRLAYCRYTHSSPTYNINTEHLNLGIYLIRIRNPETGKVATNRIVVKE